MKKRNLNESVNNPEKEIVDKFHNNWKTDTMESLDKGNKTKNNSISLTLSNINNNNKNAVKGKKYLPSLKTKLILNDKNHVSHVSQIEGDNQTSLNNLNADNRINKNLEHNVNNHGVKTLKNNSIDMNSNMEMDIKDANTFINILTTLNSNFTNSIDTMVYKISQLIERKTLHILSILNNDKMENIMLDVNLYYPKRKFIGSLAEEAKLENLIKEFIDKTEIEILNEDKTSNYKLICLKEEKLIDKIYYILDTSRKYHSIKILDDKLNVVSKGFLNNKSSVLFCKVDVVNNQTNKGNGNINLNNSNYNTFTESNDIDKNKFKKSNIIDYSPLLTFESDGNNLNNAKNSKILSKGFNLNNSKSKKKDKIKQISKMKSISKNNIELFNYLDNELDNETLFVGNLNIYGDLKKEKEKKHKILTLNSEKLFKRKDSLEKIKENKKYEKNLDHDFFTNFDQDNNQIEQKKKQVKVNIDLLFKDQKNTSCNVKEENTFHKQLLGNQNLSCKFVKSSIINHPINTSQDRGMFETNKTDFPISSNYNTYNAVFYNKSMNKGKSKYSHIPLLTDSSNNENFMSQPNFKNNFHQIISKKLFKNKGHSFKSLDPALYNIKSEKNTSHGAKNNSINVKNLVMDKINSTDKHEILTPVRHSSNIIDTRKQSKLMMSTTNLKNSSKMRNSSITLKKINQENILEQMFMIRKNNISIYNNLFKRFEAFVEFSLHKVLQSDEIAKLFIVNKSYFADFQNQNIPMNQYYKEFLYYSFVSDSCSKILKEKYNYINFRAFFESSFEHMKKKVQYENYFEKEELRIYFEVLNKILEDSEKNNNVSFFEYIRNKTVSSFIFVDSFFFKNFIFTKTIYKKNNLYIDLLISSLGIDMRLNFENYLDFKLYFDTFNITISFKKKFLFLKKMLNSINFTQKFYVDDMKIFQKLFTIDKRYYLIIKELEIKDLVLVDKKKRKEIENFCGKIVLYVKSEM